jgi:hypothetical protein
VPETPLSTQTNHYYHSDSGDAGQYDDDDDYDEVAATVHQVIWNDDDEEDNDDDYVDIENDDDDNGSNEGGAHRIVSVANATDAFNDAHSIASSSSSAAPSEPTTPLSSLFLTPAQTPLDDSQLSLASSINSNASRASARKLPHSRYQHQVFPSFTTSASAMFEHFIDGDASSETEDNDRVLFRAQHNKTNTASKVARIRKRKTLCESPYTASRSTSVAHSAKRRKTDGAFCISASSSQHTPSATAATSANSQQALQTTTDVSSSSAAAAAACSSAVGVNGATTISATNAPLCDTIARCRVPPSRQFILRRQLALLSNQLEKRNSTITELQDALVLLNNQHQQVLADKDEQQLLCQQQQQQYQSLLADYNAAASNEDSLVEQTEQLRLRLEASQAKLLDLESDVAEARHKEEQLVSELDTTKELSDTLLAQLEHVTSCLEECHAQRSQLEQESQTHISRLEAQIQSLTEQLQQV